MISLKTMRSTRKMIRRCRCRAPARCWAGKRLQKSVPCANRAQQRRQPRNFLMTRSKQLTTATFLALAVLACLSSQADAAQCGSSAAGFEAWKSEFAGEARAKGISASTVSALMATHYAGATIAADRGQRSFGLSLDQFLAKRGASTIVARGRALKQSQGALFSSIQQRYGVPPG